MILRCGQHRPGDEIKKGPGQGRDLSFNVQGAD